ncbi:unnamed protein product [Penicillium nalgiovense]|nr:unnamed protein product [Penicillium nalgiovense]
MVSFWPWKGDDNSAASFEKTLSTLSTKIAEATTRLDQQRQSSRRIKALWTLYSTFAYLFYSIILALVLGWESWGVKEYAAIAGGPALCVCPEVNLHVPTSLTPGLRIYGVRTLSSRVFDYRISRLQRRLDDFNKQREETIEKLKIATKYNSTQQLLEKYGACPAATACGPHGSPAAAHRQHSPSYLCITNTKRPAIPRLSLSPYRVSPGRPADPTAVVSLTSFPSPNTHRSSQLCTERIPPQSGEQLHWYDRLLDVLLGEDETQPRNRMVMMCSACRLVNGQAPPGIKTPEELGRWRCGSCQAWNGVESETTKILSSLRQDAGPPEGTWEPVPKAEADTQYSGGMEEGVMVASGEEEQVDSVGSDAEDQKEESKPAPVRRSKRGATGNKA